MNPSLFEQTVASVFKLQGYDVWVTGRSGDDGIDIVLCDGQSTIGVQVKRHSNAIKVEQIRSLAGALVLNGHTRGIFVTTSSFQRGAESSVKRFAQRGYAIELYDATKFLSALKVSQRNMYRSIEEFTAVQSVDQMQLISFNAAF
jgi:restriction system protein